MLVFLHSTYRDVARLRSSRTATNASSACSDQTMAYPSVLRHVSGIHAIDATAQNIYGTVLHDGPSVACMPAFQCISQ